MFGALKRLKKASFNNKRQVRLWCFILFHIDVQVCVSICPYVVFSASPFSAPGRRILDVEQPGYFLPTMHSAPRQPSRRVKQTTALHCQRLRIAFISPLFTLSYAKLFFIVCCTNNSVNGDDLAFFRIPNEASERERRGI